jgi:hypothetical protein
MRESFAILERLKPEQQSTDAKGKVTQMNRFVCALNVHASRVIQNITDLQNLGRFEWLYCPPVVITRRSTIGGR